MTITKLDDDKIQLVEERTQVFDRADLVKQKESLEAGITKIDELLNAK